MHRLKVVSFATDQLSHGHKILELQWIKSINVWCLYQYIYLYI